MTLVLLACGAYLAFDAFAPRAKQKASPGARAVSLLLLSGAATLGAVASRAQVSAEALLGLAFLAVAGFLGWQSSRPGMEGRSSPRPDQVVTPVDRDINNKFVLVTVD
ncbi:MULTISPECIES: hypothetical protein [Corallococcus]|uniref:hypothetical protein n=1 Tax=Corallococcus TaxID=83461 RepID=UPI0013153F33|nr:MULTISPECIES: hypothetical protein [Corallococcus]